MAIWKAYPKDYSLFMLHDAESSRCRLDTLYQEYLGIRDTCLPCFKDFVLFSAQGFTPIRKERVSLCASFLSIAKELVS